MADDNSDWILLDGIEKGISVSSNWKQRGRLVQCRNEGINVRHVEVSME